MAIPRLLLRLVAGRGGDLLLLLLLLLLSGTLHRCRGLGGVLLQLLPLLTVQALQAQL